MTARAGDVALLEIWRRWNEIEAQLVEHISTEPKHGDPEKPAWETKAGEIHAAQIQCEAELAATPASGFVGLAVKLHTELYSDPDPILVSAYADAERLAKCDAGADDPPIPPAPVDDSEDAFLITAVPQLFDLWAEANKAYVAEGDDAGDLINDCAQALVERIVATPARSLDGAAVKLRIVLHPTMGLSDAVTIGRDIPLLEDVQSAIGCIADAERLAGAS